MSWAERKALNTQEKGAFKFVWAVQGGGLGQGFISREWGGMGRKAPEHKGSKPEWLELEVLVVCKLFFSSSFFFGSTGI